MKLREIFKIASLYKKAQNSDFAQGLVKTLQELFDYSLKGARAMGGGQSDEWIPELNRFVEITVIEVEEEEDDEDLIPRGTFLEVEVTLLSVEQMKAREQWLRRAGQIHGAPQAFPGFGLTIWRERWRQGDIFQFPAEGVTQWLLDWNAKQEAQAEEAESSLYNDPRHYPKHDDLDEEPQPGPEDSRWNENQPYAGLSPELEEERARKQQHALDLLSRPAPKRYASLFEVAKRFVEKYAVYQRKPGKDYIKQDPNGRLLVDNIFLDRDALNAMKSWKDLVDMGISSTIVGEIAREYGGHPKDVDVWLEQNSTPMTNHLTSNNHNVLLQLEQAYDDLVLSLKNGVDQITFNVNDETYVLVIELDVPRRGKLPILIEVHRIDPNKPKFSTDSWKLAYLNVPVLMDEDTPDEIWLIRDEKETRGGKTRRVEKLNYPGIKKYLMQIKPEIMKKAGLLDIS